MKVLMTGGSGFLGSAIRERLEERGDSITVLSRSRTGVVGATTFVANESLRELEAHDAIINLAGESVVGLWTNGRRREIYDSRIDTTRELVEWMERLSSKPLVFLSGSAVGIYGDAGDEELTEKSDVSAREGFLAKVCRDWEQAASPAAWKGTRTVLLRTGHVLDPRGGYLKQVLPILRKLPIVVLGPREAYLPWIALSDWVGLVLRALEDEAFTGPLNLAAPNAATQGQFTGQLARRLGKRVWGRVPRWAIKLGAGEFGESITSSQRVLPAKALGAGFEFRYSEVADYLESTPLLP